MTTRPSLRPFALALLFSLPLATGCTVNVSTGSSSPESGGLSTSKGDEARPNNDGSGPVVEDPGQEPASQPMELGAYPGELIPTADIGQEFMARQELEGEFNGETFKFSAVLQVKGGVLTVLGLTPMGTKAFILEQEGTEVRFTALIDRQMPFPPEFVLQDVHRTWLWHARLPWGDRPSEEAPSTEIAGERVSEVWTNGALVRRTFERLDGQPEGSLRVDYIGGHRTGKPAERVVIDNGWFGYRLEIETVEWQKL